MTAWLSPSGPASCAQRSRIKRNAIDPAGLTGTVLRLVIDPIRQLSFPLLFDVFCRRHNLAPLYRLRAVEAARKHHLLLDAQRHFRGTLENFNLRNAEHD